MKKIPLVVLLVLCVTALSYADGAGREFGGDLRMGYSFPFLGKAMYSHFGSSTDDPALFVVKQALLS